MGYFELFSAIFWLFSAILSCFELFWAILCYLGLFSPHTSSESACRAKISAFRMSRHVQKWVLGPSHLYSIAQLGARTTHFVHAGAPSINLGLGPRGLISSRFWVHFPHIQALNRPLEQRSRPFECPATWAGVSLLYRATGGPDHPFYSCQRSVYQVGFRTPRSQGRSTFQNF